MKAVKVLFGIVLSLGLTMNAHAFDITWIGGGAANDWWTDSGNWSGGTPQDNDDVFLLEFNSENKDIEYDKSAILRLNSLTVDGDIKLVLPWYMGGYDNRLVVLNQEFIGRSDWPYLTYPDFVAASAFNGGEVLVALLDQGYLKATDALANQYRINADRSVIDTWLGAWTNSEGAPLTSDDRTAISNLLATAQGKVGNITQDSGYHRVGHDGGSYPGAGNFYLGAGEWVNPGTGPEHHYGKGYYTLNGGTLDAYSEVIGGVEGPDSGWVGFNGYSSGAGYFTQNGGTNLAGNLFIGVTPESYGEYTLNNGNLTVGQWETIGGRGIGHFIQKGGTHEVLSHAGDQGVVVIGATENGPGAYDISGGQFLVRSNDIVTHPGHTTGMIVGEQGVGVVNQSGDSYVEIENDLILGKNRFDDTGIPNTTQGDGTYNLYSGTLWVKGKEFIGLDGKGTFNQYGGEHIVGDDFVVEAPVEGQGNYYLYAIGSTGEPTLHATSRMIIGGTMMGNMSQYGGINTIDQDLIIGQNQSASGNYEMTGGSLSVLHNVIVGLIGNGGLVLDQGENETTVGGAMIVGEKPDSYGTVTFNQGNMTVGSLIVGKEGNGTFSHLGGNVNVQNDVTLGQDSAGTGWYELSGGELNVTGDVLVGKNGQGTFHHDNGAVLTASVINVKSGSGQGMYNLIDGTINARVVNNDNFTAYNGTINGDVDNYGKFKIDTGIVNVNGTFTNYGELNSDPAVTNFTNLVVESDGYLVGGAGDVFTVSGYFKTSSTNPLWNTSEAKLAFIGAGAHDWQFLGDNPTPNSMQWGSLKIGDGAEINVSGAGSLHLASLEIDGAGAFHIDGAGNLYIGSIIIPDGNPSRLASLFAGQDISVSFDTIQDSNGTPIGLSGYILPDNIVMTPEPVSVVLFGLGGVAMAFARRKRE